MMSFKTRHLFCHLQEALVKQVIGMVNRHADLLKPGDWIKKTDTLELHSYLLLMPTVCHNCILFRLLKLFLSCMRHPFANILYTENESDKQNTIKMCL